MTTLVVLMLAQSAAVGGGTAEASARAPLGRIAHTYSIVARDMQTGELGVAVQSHWFSVGPIVPWAEAGVGAVATQSLVDPAYGPLGLTLMRAGRSAPEALRSVLAGDPGREVRQVAMIDAKGRVAVHTGAKCIPAAGHVLDVDGQFSVQANLMEHDTVWPAMAKAFRDAEGDLADRMVAALEAAEAAGGDIRGAQSAALVVVAAEATGKSWIDRRYDLRVEDHPDPVTELKRLVRLQRAYLHMNAGDVAMETGDVEAARKEYGAAAGLAPEVVEIRFWQAVTLAGAGQVDQSLPIFKEVFAKEPIWATLIPRLVKVGLFPDDSVLIEKVMSQAS